jgi:hypothetical protein
MLIILLFVLGLGNYTTPAHPPTEEGPPTLIVQVVDPAYIPLPESEVAVRQVSGEKSVKSEYVDQNGYARFWLERGKQYLIEAKSSNFKKKSLTVTIGQPKAANPTAHVQIMLKPNEGSFGKY